MRGCLHLSCCSYSEGDLGLQLRIISTQLALVHAIFALNLATILDITIARVTILGAQISILDYLATLQIIIFLLILLQCIKELLIQLQLRLVYRILLLLLDHLTTRFTHKQTSIM
jgi:hypothetical protein